MVPIIFFCATTGYFYISYKKGQDDYHTLTNDFNILNSKLNRTQIWLDGNKTLLDKITAERDQLQTWLTGNITSYETQIQDLNEEVDNLNLQIQDLNGEIASLNSYIEELEMVDLDGYARLSWILFDFDFEGEVWNYGTETAYSVSVTVCLYDRGYEVYSKTIYIGDISGRDVVTFETSFVCIDYWDDWDWYTNY
ncbi:MAG: hypothetical protein U9R05_06935 [Chloroflexota bacterium]|nr:hypothetical protein [Chloroflexota bacterium]